MVTEHTTQGEEVITVINKIAPSDTQCCAANARGNRCKHEIYFDSELDSWSSLCEKHHKQNEEARSGNGKKVVIFSE